METQWAQGRGSGGGTNPRPRSARNRRPSEAGGGGRRARCVSVGGSYSLKLASIAATRSFSASMSCWFTSSIFCKSEREAFSA